MDETGRSLIPKSFRIEFLGRRRAFITLAAEAATWPLAVRAQQGERMRRIGALLPYGANDAQGQARNAAFLQGLLQSGWVVGRNLQIDYRWITGGADDTRRYAAELVALAPDVIFASGSTTMGPLLQATRDVPIVFVNVADPVGAGHVDSLARPGGNATGFVLFEYGISGKMAGTAQRDRAGRDESGSHSRSCHNCRDRPVGRNSVRGTVTRTRGASGQRARRW
jgi:hypothetical protein